MWGVVCAASGRVKGRLRSCEKLGLHQKLHPTTNTTTQHHKGSGCPIPLTVFVTFLAVCIRNCFLDILGNYSYQYQKKGRIDVMHVHIDQWNVLLARIDSALILVILIFPVAFFLAVVFSFFPTQMGSLATVWEG